MRFLGAVLVSACALGVFAGSAHGASGVQFGIQDDAWLEFGPGRLSDRVAKLDRLGLDVVRVTLNWYRAEPSEGDYRWSRSDRLLNALRARGLEPVVTLWGTPGWANGENAPNVAPLRGEDFQRFAFAAAQRYPFVSKWIMWNEPNKPIWLRPASARTYVSRILNPGYLGIKAANRRARVAGGVTGPRAGQGRRLAGRLHPRDGSGGSASRRVRAPPVSRLPRRHALRRRVSVQDVDDGVARTASALRRPQRFPSARIWLTEYAYQTNPPDVFGVSRDDPGAASSARPRGAFYQAPKVDMLIHYLYRDEPDLARWQSGLETVDGEAKPALAATMLPLAQVAAARNENDRLGPGAAGQRSPALRPPAVERRTLGRGRRRCDHRPPRLLPPHGSRLPRVRSSASGLRRSASPAASRVVRLARGGDADARARAG